MLTYVETSVILSGAKKCGKPPLVGGYGKLE